MHFVKMHSHNLYGIHENSIPFLRRDLAAAHFTSLLLLNRETCQIYLTGVHLMWVYLINVYLTGLHLIGMHLTGVHLMVVYLMGVHLIGVYLRRVPHRRVPRRRASHRCASHGRASHENLQILHLTNDGRFCRDLSIRLARRRWSLLRRTGAKVAAHYTSRGSSIAYFANVNFLQWRLRLCLRRYLAVLLVNLNNACRQRGGTRRTR